MLTQWRKVTSISLAYIVAGCATNASNAPVDEWAWTKQPVVVAQFCVTNPASRDFYKFMTVDVETNGAPASAGLDTAYPVGVTTAGQIVYEGYGAIPPRVLRAVLLFGKDGGELVYFPQNSVPSDKWGNWQSADFESDDREIQLKLLSSQKYYEKHAPPSNAPKARFRLRSYIDFRGDKDKHRAGNGELDLPPC